MSRSIWRIAGASVEGTSHTERGDGCQDYHKFDSVHENGEDIVVVAVADGAGSASEGLAGAKRVCNSFMKAVGTHWAKRGPLEHLDQEFMARWIERMQEKIDRTARVKGIERRDYACTLLAAFISPEGTVFFQLGDGAIVYSTVDQPDVYQFAIVPAEKVYVNTTDFITDADAAQKIKVQFLPIAVANVGIFTDGIQGLAIDYSDGGAGKPHKPFWTPMFAPFSKNVDPADLTKKLEVFLASDTVNRRTDDDKTLILISRDAASPSAAGAGGSKETTR